MPRKKKKIGLKARPTRDARLNILIDPVLKEWICRYAIKKHTTVTAIITNHFVALRDIEEGGNVQQI